MHWVKVTMSDTQTKIIRHKMSQEDTTHNDENNQSAETNPELTQILELYSRCLESRDTECIIKIPN